MASRFEIAVKQNLYGWSAIVDFTLGSSGGVQDIEDRKASLLWNHDLILGIEPRKFPSNQMAAGQSGYRLRIDAVETAGEAERIGIRLAYAILKVAIKRSWGLGLAWEDAQLPCRVVDRTIGRRRSIPSSFSHTSHIKPEDLIEQLEVGFSVYEDVPKELLLSMELYAAANLESNMRVKLVMMVSALEALATQEDLEKQVGSVVSDLVAVVEAANVSDDHLRDSLKGQIRNLVRESARSAINRLLEKNGMSKEDIKIVESAYEARSKVVHEARRVSDLGSIVRPLDSIMQRLYSIL